jgi:nuclease-like protein
MFGRSIYVPDNPAWVGGSPQSINEQLWAQGRRRRLQIRGGLAAGALILGTLLLSLPWGLLAAILTAAADTLWHWRQRAASSVWRKGMRGERRTARVLRALVEWRGYHVLHGRNIPGRGQIDHLIIGGTGIMLVQNEAVPPETQMAGYRGRLYIDERPAAKVATELRDMADEASEMLRQRLGRDVLVEPVKVVYGGDLRGGVVSADGITMLRAHRLPGWVRNRRVRYTPEQVGEIYEAASTLPISRQALFVR